MPVEDRSVETRQRLLEAAGGVFAECGFRSATIRAICRRARANVAAVYYHFGDKSALYAAVLKMWSGVALRKYPPTLGLKGHTSAEERLRAFIRSLLLRVTDQGRPAWHSAVMAREMIEPTAAFDDLVQDVMRPLQERLGAIVRELLGGRGTEEQIRFCVWSIMGQCLYYRHGRHVITRLCPKFRYEPPEIERAVEHVTQFSLRAIRQLAKELSR
jgi:TetR/AcrR family transcriptional regulator, regulator of cefoperazone and chloramphenicol sensitivity